MRHLLFIGILLIFAQASAQTEEASSGYYRYLENKGQWPSEVVFSADVEYGKVFLEKDGLTFDFYHPEDVDLYTSAHHSKTASPKIPQSLRAHAWKLQFLEALPTSPEGKNPLNGSTHFYLGEDAEKWATNCEGFKEVTWNELYPGIDLRLYSKDFLMKYDLIVKPAAEVSQIKWHYQGIETPKLRNGRIIVSSNVNEVIEQKPISYQIIGGQKRIIRSTYTLNDGIFGFEILEEYDTSLPLIIDPELIFSSYTGSFSNNFGYTATYDDQGFLYSGSSAFGNDYPSTLGSYEENFQGGIVDMAITKWDTTGTFFVWSAYLGGSNDELPHSLIVNSARELFVYGTTSSTDYPTTPGAYDTEFNGGAGINLLQGLGVNYTNGSDIVVSRFSEAGDNLVASTYVGGSDNDGLNSGTPLKYNYADEIRGEVLIDNDNNIYIASSTNSSDFPTTPGVYQSVYGGGEQEGCLFKLDNNLSTMLWSTYLGGSDNDAVYAVDLDSDENVIVCGGTESNDFPITFGTIQQSLAGGIDGFVSRLSADGATLLQSSYWGTDAYDQIYFVELDTEDQVHVFGQTEVDGDAYIINADYGAPSSGQFITKFQEDLDEVIWSTAFGSGSGQPNISPTAFLVDLCNKIYLSGWGSSIQGGPLTVEGMDVTPDAYQSTTDGDDFYLFVLEDDASDIFYGSYYGGTSSSEHVDGGTSRFDRKGVMYQAVCAGCGGNDDFPIFPDPGAHSPFNNSNCNLGVFKFDFNIPVTVADFFAPDAVCIEEPIAIENLSSEALNFEWIFGDGTESSETQPQHFYDEPGTYTIQLIASNPETCNLADTISQAITVLSNTSSFLEAGNACANEDIQIGIAPSSDPDIRYTWIPDDFLSSGEIANPIFNGDMNLDYTLLISNGICTDTLFQSVAVTNLDISVTDDLTICNEAENVELSAQSSEPGVSFTWSFNDDFSDPLNDPEDNSVNLLIEEPTTLYAQAELNGCTVNDQIEIDFVSSQLELGNNELICPGDSVLLTVSSPNPGLQYSWSPEAEIISGQGTSEVWVSPQSPTTYIVNGQLTEECVVSDSVLVDLSSLEDEFLQATAEPNTILAGDTVQLNALPDGYDYQWSPFEGVSNPLSQNPTAHPEVSTTYFVSVEDGDCIYGDSVRVAVVDFICGPPLIYLPNAFTPNGDGQNDILYVRGANLTRVSLKVYNRWGEKVFETDQQSDGWDGSYKGNSVDPAVFVYYLEADCGDGNTYFEKGNITLIR